jgi:hypothetical protein
MDKTNDNKDKENRNRQDNRREIIAYIDRHNLIERNHTLPQRILNIKITSNNS